MESSLNDYSQLDPNRLKERLACENENKQDQNPSIRMRKKFLNLLIYKCELEEAVSQQEKVIQQQHALILEQTRTIQNLTIHSQAIKPNEF